MSLRVAVSFRQKYDCSCLLKQKSGAPLRDHRCGPVTWQVLPPLWSSHLAGKGHMGSGSGEGVPLEVLPALCLSVVAPLLVQSSGVTLPNLSRPPLWSSHLAGAHERNAFGPPLWSSCQAGTRKAEGSLALPLGADPRTEQKKGHRPKNRHSERKGKAVSCRPRASRSSSQGRDVGSAVSGLLFLVLPVGRSGWLVLVPCRSWLFPLVLSGLDDKGTVPSTGSFRHSLTYYSILVYLLLYFAYLGLRVLRLAVMGYDRSRRPTCCELDHTDCPQIATLLSVVLVFVCCLPTTRRSA